MAKTKPAAKSDAKRQGAATPATPPTASPPAPTVPVQIPLNEIREAGNHRQRTKAQEKADTLAIAQIAATMQTRGLLQPIKVRPYVAGGYTPVYGRRRIAAARLNGWATILAIVAPASMTDADAEEECAIENLQRENLSPAEEAIAVGMVLQRRRIELEDLGDVPMAQTIALAAAHLGKPEKWVRDRVYLARLSKKVTDMLGEGRINLNQAREIAVLGDEKEQLAIAQIVAIDPDLNERGQRIYTAAETRSFVQQKQYSLAVVPWKLDQAVQNLPPCIGCQHNTATDLMLPGFEVLPAGEVKDFCLNPACYEGKQKCCEGAKERLAGQVLAGKWEPDAVSVAARAPDYVKPESVLRFIKKKVAEKEAAAGGGGGKGKKAGAKAADPEPVEHVLTPKEKLGDAMADWEGDMGRKFEDCLYGDPLALVGLILLSYTKYGDLITTSHIDPKQATKALASSEGQKLRGLIYQRDLAGLTSLAEIVAGELKKGLADWNFLTDLSQEAVEVLAEGLQIELPAKPKLEDFLAKAVPPAAGANVHRQK